eukprot:361917-Chlamydomonas_euryale.AAC.8
MGKTTVGRFFTARGIPLLDADEVRHLNKPVHASPATTVRGTYVRMQACYTAVKPWQTSLHGAQQRAAWDSAKLGYRSVHGDHDWALESACMVGCMALYACICMCIHHRLETIHEQCGTPSLELMIRRRTLQWMGRVLRMDVNRLPRQVFDCLLARSVAEDGRVEQLKLRQGHRNMKDFSGMYSSAIGGWQEEGSGGGTTFRDYLELPGHTKLIPWPKIRAAAASRALDRQAWRDVIKNLVGI